MSETSFDQQMLNQINNIIGNFVVSVPEALPLVSSPTMPNGDLINNIIDSFASEFVSDFVEQAPIPEVKKPVAKTKATKKVNNIALCSLPVAKPSKKDKPVSDPIKPIEELKETKSFIPHIDSIKIQSSFLDDPRIKEAGFSFSDDRSFSHGAINILVVGCGGTGSRLIELLAQAKMFKYRNLIGSIIICDMDKIKSKNLERQLFYDFEVGDYKAMALAERFNMIYGTELFYPYNKAVSDLFNDGTIFNYMGSGTPIIVFDCTDNFSARKDIEENVAYNFGILSGSSLIISCGNEKDFGQVIVGTPVNDHTCVINRQHSFNTFNVHTQLVVNNLLKIATNPKNAINTVDYMPSMLHYMHNFQDSVAPSCANIEEQSLVINSLIANQAFSVLCEYLDKRSYNTHITYVNTRGDFGAEVIKTTGDYLSVLMRSLYNYNCPDYMVNDGLKFVNDIIIPYRIKHDALLDVALKVYIANSPSAVIEPDRIIPHIADHSVRSGLNNLEKKGNWNKYIDTKALTFASRKTSSIYGNSFSDSIIHIRGKFLSGKLSLDIFLDLFNKNFKFDDTKFKISEKEAWTVTNGGNVFQTFNAILDRLVQFDPYLLTIVYPYFITYILPEVIYPYTHQTKGYDKFYVKYNFLVAESCLMGYNSKRFIEFIKELWEV